MVKHPRIAVGLHLPPKPPVYSAKAMVYAARLMRLDSLTFWDHFQDIFPQSLWDRDLTWLSMMSKTPHDFFDYQVFLGYLAARAGRLRIGVAVTEPIRRHPVLIAQSMITLAHLTRRAPILGIGSGERENIEPYGLPFDEPVGTLEEALQIIRMCFESSGSMQFEGKHFRLEGAFLDLKPPKRKTPEIWVASHGPRMLRLTGQYGDGWYPTVVAGPGEYAAKLAVIRDAARAAGRDPGKIVPALQAYVVTAPSEREVRKMLDSRAVRFIGVLAPAAVWRQFGETHPFGDDFRGFIDFIPDRYTRRELDDAIAAVPADVLGEALFAGTPEQIVSRLRDWGRAGLRHVALDLASAMVSPKAAGYALWATPHIARDLRSG